MGIDRQEALSRGASTQEKVGAKHPYAAIQHRVIESKAYPDLTFAARSLLLQLARQLTKDNNGHLIAAKSYLQQYGFGSEHTISRCIKELIAHGFVYRTRMGGYQQGASLYAVTWLSITKREGLFLAGFKPCAWRDWKPEEKNLPPSKMQPSSCKKGKLTAATDALYASDSPTKTADIELMPVGVVVDGANAQQERVKDRERRSLAEPYCIRLESHLDRPPLRLVS